MSDYSEETPFLFVYGTLKRAFDNPFAKKLRNASTFLDEGNFPGLLYRISWYPAAIYLPESDSRVQGELYRMHAPRQTLKLLDEYEEVMPDWKEGLFVRKIIKVLTRDERTFSSWAYLYNRPVDGLETIPDGKFNG